MDNSPHHHPSAVPFGTEELEDLYEHAPCGYLSLEPGGRVSRVNATFLAWTGHSAEDLLGQPFQNLLSIAGKVFYETHFTPLLRLQGSFSEVALDVLGGDGKSIPVLVNATERRDSDGNPRFIRITVFNATDRRRYERELLKARNELALANQELRDQTNQLEKANRQLDLLNRELHAFYQTLPVGIFRADASGDVVHASRRFFALLGIDMVKNWLEAITDANNSSAVQQLQNAFRKAEPFSRRIGVAADGATPPRCIEIKAVPIRGEVDGAPAFVGVANDVTEQMRAEAQRRQIDRDVVVRKLTGSLAHNLNNILLIVIGNLELLEHELEDRPALRPVLGGSLLAVERASALVSRLLVYFGHSTAQFDRVDIDACLQEIAEGLVRRLGDDHRLTCDLCKSGAVIELDTVNLREAIEELVKNAVESMPEGGKITLSSRLERIGSSGDQHKIVIGVNDAGVGMDEATLAKAHEPFFSMQEAGQGTGLGLSFVDGVSRIAGGHFVLRSNLGNGTTAEMHLPVVNT